MPEKYNPYAPMSASCLKHIGKPFFMMMCGLPAGGKTTYAKKLAEETGALLLSSDDIREEFNYDPSSKEDHKKVFSIMESETLKALKNNLSVIYDATNIHRKNRMNFLDKLQCLGVFMVCTIMAKPYDLCLIDNYKRKRIVPGEVIERMYKQWQTPYYFEGWDKMDLVYPYGYDPYIDVNTEFEKYMSYDQNNPHHTLTLGKHMEETASQISKINLPDLIDAALIHDIGKIYTRTTDKNGCSHYYNHENVGAYEALFSNATDIVGTSVLVNLHMEPFHWGEGDEKTKSIHKYKELWGPILTKEVCDLFECDKLAH